MERDSLSINPDRKTIFLESEIIEDGSLKIALFHKPSSESVDFESDRSFFRSFVNRFHVSVFSNSGKSFSIP
jgi:hypothetical protein